MTGPVHGTAAGSLRGDRVASLHRCTNGDMRSPQGPERAAPQIEIIVPSRLPVSAELWGGAGSPNLRPGSKARKQMFDGDACGIYKEGGSLGPPSLVSSAAFSPSASCFPWAFRPFAPPCRPRSSDRTQPSRLSEAHYERRYALSPSASSPDGRSPAGLCFRLHPAFTGGRSGTNNPSAPWLGPTGASRVCP